MIFTAHNTLFGKGYLPPMTTKDVKWLSRTSRLETTPSFDAGHIYFMQTSQNNDALYYFVNLLKKRYDLVRVRTEDLTVNSRALYQLSYEVEKEEEVFFSLKSFSERNP
tara:strand:+ start:328 stop:654 length:327 start_codon:yes stop_codon:yes gene_type:complete